VRYVSANFVIQLLRVEWKESLCVLLHYAEVDENFFESVITGGEAWVYECGPVTKQQSSHWKTSLSL
jgi:hypothetical protein